MISVQKNCVKFALRSAYAAADTFILVHNRCAAAKTSSCLSVHLLLRKRTVCIPERMNSVYRFVHCRFLSARRVVCINANIVFVKLVEITAVSAYRHTCARMYKAVKRNSSILAGFNSVDNKFRSGVYIAANEYIRLRCLICKRICHRIISVPKFHLLVLQKISPVDRLSNGKDHMLARNGYRGLLVIYRIEFSVFIRNRGAFFKYNTCHISSLVLLDFLWTPAVLYGDILLERLFYFIRGSRHRFPGFETIHRHILCAESGCCACAIHGNISAADNDRASRKLSRLILRSLMQEINRNLYAMRVAAIDCRNLSTLTADSNIKRLEVLPAQFI